MFSKFKNFLLAIPAGLAFFGAKAMAALPEGFQTAVTDMQSDAEEAINAVWPAVKAVLVALLVIAAIWLVYRQIRKALGR